MSLHPGWKDRDSPLIAVESLAPYQKRVLDECEELDGRLESLHVFIEDSPVFRGLSKIEQRLLVDQRHAMTVYRDILRERIKLFR